MLTPLLTEERRTRRGEDDRTALRIVRLAAPYPAFPVEMRKEYDQLEIIRTWQFSRTGARLDG